MMKSRALMSRRRVDVKRDAEIVLTKRLCRGPSLMRSRPLWCEEVSEVAESYMGLAYFHIFTENLGGMIVMRWRDDWLIITTPLVPRWLNCVAVNSLDLFVTPLCWNQIEYAEISRLLVTRWGDCREQGRCASWEVGNKLLLMELEEASFVWFRGSVFTPHQE